MGITFNKQSGVVSIAHKFHFFLKAHTRKLCEGYCERLDLYESVIKSVLSPSLSDGNAATLDKFPWTKEGILVRMGLN